MSIQVRPMRSADFETLMRLEEEVFATAGEKVLGPYYVRLCCDFFAESCFIAVADGQPAGYILSFVRGREAYCTTLAVVPRFQGGRTAVRLVLALMRALGDTIDTCWFTVKEDNLQARALQAGLGARELGVRHDFYAPGDDRIVARIERHDFERVRDRLGRLAGKAADPAPAPAGDALVRGAA
jgi:ribosomal protein S18 acetylase RimI-like enzyme